MNALLGNLCLKWVLPIISFLSFSLGLVFTIELGADLSHYYRVSDPNTILLIAGSLVCSAMFTYLAFRPFRRVAEVSLPAPSLGRVLMVFAVGSFVSFLLLVPACFVAAYVVMQLTRGHPPQGEEAMLVGLTAYFVPISLSPGIGALWAKWWLSSKENA